MEQDFSWLNPIQNTTLHGIYCGHDLVTETAYAQWVQVNWVE